MSGTEDERMEVDQPAADLDALKAEARNIVDKAEAETKATEPVLENGGSENGGSENGDSDKESIYFGLIMFFFFFLILY